jgi:hypothetical protein
MRADDVQIPVVRPIGWLVVDDEAIIRRETRRVRRLGERDERLDLSGCDAHEREIVPPAIVIEPAEQ